MNEEVNEDQRAGVLDRHLDTVVSTSAMPVVNRGIPGEGDQSGIRFPLAVSEPQRLALDSARAKDGITRNLRIRTMIDLWRADPEFRELIDAIAASKDARLWLQQNENLKVRQWFQQSA